MADAISQTSKHKTQNPEPPSNHANQTIFVNHFLYKSALLTLFLVLLPLFPFQAPEFINQAVNARSWELFQLIFVGIAVSYGLFSKKNDEAEKDHSSKVDSAQSYVSKLLQVSSVFDDESENPDESKVQTWSSQYYREEPVVVVSKRTPVVKKETENGFAPTISEKPLLLPVRSLKQNVSEQNEMDLIEESGGKNGLINRSNSSSSSNSKRFHRNLSGSKHGEFGGINPRKFEEMVDENVVLRSPIPWRSKSGRMEMEGNGEIPGLNRSENRSFRQNSLPKTLSHSPSLSSPKKLSNSTSFSYEPQAKSSEDVVVRKKKISSPPPAPPPPPPPPQRFLRKSNSSVVENAVSPEKVFHRSVRSMPEEELSDSEVEELPERMNFGIDLKARDQNNGSQLGRSVRTFRTSEPFMEMEKKSTDYEMKFTEKKGYTSSTTINEKIPQAATRTYVNISEEENKDMENTETSDDEDSEVDQADDDNFETSLGNAETATDNSASDGGPDVDKKADEFIAKFREQIRLQRIESIRRSTTQRAGKSLR